VTRVQAGPESRQLWAAASGTPLLGFRPLRRIESGSPPAPACQRRLWCRSRRFPRPQRLAPPPTAPGLSPGNVLGVDGLQGLSLPRIGCRHRLPSPPGVDRAFVSRRSPCSPSGVCSPRKFVTAGAPCDASGARSLPGLLLLQGLVASPPPEGDPPTVFRVAPSQPGPLPARRPTLGVLTATRPNGPLRPSSLVKF
jgi:hypothetical protein